jgi:hypothetical protein
MQKEYQSASSTKEIIDNVSTNILWHVEPLLGIDQEISNYTTVVAK